MKLEYLLFNLVVIAGPILSHFNDQVKHLSRWKLKLITNSLVMIPYVIWDILVTGSHWWFNELYTLNFRLFNLPIEEWFFFITVPFGCLLVWETLPSNYRTNKLKSLRYIRAILYAALPIGLWVFSSDKQYTGLILLCFGLVALVDTILKTDVIGQQKTYYYLGIITCLIIGFNGYLTARPIVLYGETYQIGYRILSIPIEDFGYGWTLMLFNAILYEKLKVVWNGKSNC